MSSNITESSVEKRKGKILRRGWGRGAQKLTLFQSKSTSGRPLTPSPPPNKCLTKYMTPLHSLFSLDPPTHNMSTKINLIPPRQCTRPSPPPPILFPPSNKWLGPYFCINVLPSKRNASSKTLNNLLHDHHTCAKVSSRHIENLVQS